LPTIPAPMITVLRAPFCAPLAMPVIYQMQVTRVNLSRMPARRPREKSHHRAWRAGPGAQSARHEAFATRVARPDAAGAQIRAG
jgi:hypothetical protein